MAPRTHNDIAFTLSYQFQAPRQLVFEAFSNADALNAWWGPVGLKTTVVHLDFREGGIFHYKMEGENQVRYGRFLFRKISPYHTLEFTNAFADEHARVVPAPFEIRLPREILYQLRFRENKGITTIAMKATPWNANDEEIEGFTSIRSSMVVGFSATFEKLKKHLAGT
jgi:uncharacterized protein YndB with AHSA1/START domain